MHFVKDEIKNGFAYAGRIFFKYIIVEYNLWSKFCHLYLEVGKNYTIGLAIPPIALFFSFGNGKYKDKKIGISIHDWAIWWDFWVSTMEWSNETPKYRKGSFQIDDFLFGKAKYSRKILETRDVDIPMPEGCYSAHIELCEDTWKRPLGFQKTIKRIDAKMPKGIPHQGKGENSWDCGEDACFGMCCPAVSIADGVGKIVGSVLRDRVRYGDWGDWNYQRRKNEQSKEE